MTLVEIMKNIALITLLVFFKCNLVFGQENSEYIQLISQAEDFYDNKDFLNSLNYYEKAFEIQNTKNIDLYNGACSAALSGKLTKALDLLDLAIKNGYDDWKHMQSDCDLQKLRSEKEWNALEKAIEESRNSSKILNEITTLIKNNQYLEIWNFTGTKYQEDNKLESFKEEIQKLNQISNGKQLKLVAKHSHQQYKLNKSYEETIYHTAEFAIIPIITESINSEVYFNYNNYIAGDKLVLKLFKFKNTWKIADINYSSQKIQKDSILSKTFIDFFNIKDTLNLTYSLHSISINNTLRVTRKFLQDDSENIKNLILDIFDEIETLSDNKNITKTTQVENIISVTLFKRDFSNSDFFNNPTKNVLQIIYFEHSEMVLLCKDKYEYGLFHLPKKNFKKRINNISTRFKK